MGSPKRKIKNFVIAPGFQFRFSLYFVLMGVSVIGVFISQIFIKIEELKTKVAIVPEIKFTDQYAIVSGLDYIMVKAVVTVFSYALFCLIFSIVVSHRIAGPMLVINRYIRDLIDGRFDVPRGLRKSDELSSVMDNLKELEQVLKQKKS
ncbi:MAG: hypothetical protein A4S09_01205 [Proteobacteria bacterium SG_bin7]|nr:MAG: hypothetical protein A4S09_01205 [Proteobacteria bacterium SG_bin7]